MSTPLTPKGCKIYYRPESSFLNASGAWRALDFTGQMQEDFEIAEPEKNTKILHTIGSGRLPSNIIEGGYKAAEMSVNFDLLSGILLKYALGKDTVTTVTEGVYEHTIESDDNLLPSFQMFVEQPFSSPYKYILSGIKVKSLQIDFEYGEDTPIKATADLIIAKTATTTDTPTDVILNTRRFNYVDVNPIKFTYGGADFITKDLLNKYSIKIENEIEYENEFGEEYPKRVKEGKRTFTITSDQRILSSQYLELSKTLFRNYTGDLATIAKCTRSTNDYIQLQANKLILKPMKNKLPSWETKILSQELTFESGPGCSISFTVRDNISTY